MKGSGAFLVIVVGLLLLAAVLYGKTGCFGGFWNCLFGSLGSGAPSGVPNFTANLPRSQPPGTVVTAPIGSM